MKKITAIVAFVLTMALVLSSFMMPAATTATGSDSNWVASSGSVINSESSEIWVVDTVKVNLAGSTGFIQNTQFLEEFVGSNGAGDAFCAGVMYGLHEEWPLEDAMRLGSACSNFNLRSATASGGAVTLEKMQSFLQNCKYTPMPEVEFN